MSTLTLTLSLVAISSLGFLLGRRRSLALVGHPKELASLPGYYGAYVLLWAGVPAVLLSGIWLAVEPGVLDSVVLSHQSANVRELPPGELKLFLSDVERLAGGGALGREADPVIERAAAVYLRTQSLSARARAAAALALALLGGALAWRRISDRFRPHLPVVGGGPPPAAALALALLGGALAWRRISDRFRPHLPVERALRFFLLAASLVAVFATLGIVLSLIFEAIRFFRLVPVADFLFGLEWSPQTALRADQVGSSGAFGAVPLFTGTLLISAIAMLVAVPVGLLSAIFLSEYAPPRWRAICKPLLEILAGIPTVVYGFFAALTIAPAVRRLGESIGLDVASESALAAGGVMGVMIIPFVSSLSDDALTAVPQGLREASYGLGATQSETIKRVLLPAALPGIIGGILLAVSRAIGETMIVVMAAGLAANLTANPLEAVTTVTVQIVTLLVGDQEFDSAKTLAAFALGLMLFLVTLVLNVIALYVVRTYREQYE